MPNSPNQRNTRSNSNPNLQITLSDIKTLIEKSTQDMLEMVSEKMDKQTKLIDSLLQRLDEITKENKSLKKSYESLEERMALLPSSIIGEVEDRQRRRGNVIISGIPEKKTGDADERKRADEEIVQGLMQDLSVNKDDITKIHRIGKPGTGKDRLLKATFRDHDTRQELLRKARQLRDMPAHRKTFINPDLTLYQRHERKALNEELKERRGMGENVVIWRGKVVEKKKFENFH